MHWCGTSSASFAKKQSWDLFLHYLLERERVALRRARGEPPSKWTNDSVLAEFHFCHHRREDDRGSRVIREILHRRDPRKPHFLWNVITHRWLSNPPYNRELGYISNLDDALQKFAEWERAKQRTGKSWRTRAFTFCAPYKVVVDAMKVNWHLSADVGKSLFGPPDNPREPSFQEVYGNMLRFELVGDFHAYQESCDMFMCGLIPAPTAPVPGPGAKKGLEILGYRELTGYSINRLTVRVNKLLRNAYETLDKGDVLHTNDPLVLRPLDVEHILCEFQKYERLVADPSRGGSRLYKAQDVAVDADNELEAYGSDSETGLRENKRTSVRTPVRKRTFKEVATPESPDEDDFADLQDMRKQAREAWERIERAAKSANPKAYWESDLKNTSTLKRTRHSKDASVVVDSPTPPPLQSADLTSYEDHSYITVTPKRSTRLASISNTSRQTGSYFGSRRRS
ncbi:uncharacterized protein SPPG_03006 [Spizellomyces punctatus DAOM BR117]|uniref:5-hmdU DNA kinase helical domain-containing protein n=1 Tax=Spizellomyces punctatus (strain DAOM BR117) TaxID=645134 RepID=A0A0L0HNA6_SPIPD|nr:uncharacterized protein SPPG_03006 [Spizellomyces punctatus DAOM BR117]KND02548.1 hypothetical protein SPPG_03006 [Spizellomyces punctatus DAOM BR117]|eukprot:XP_016610587.1 hypothetical protein SPPG_03006 [Spizellomyces punctatus DAOM BR117]